MGIGRFQHPGPVPLRLSVVPGGPDRATRLVVGGEIDIATVGPLAETLTSILRDRQAHQLVVDFAEVGFLDSSGIAALMAAYRLAQALQVGFRLVNCRPNVLRVLEITGVDKVLTA